MSGTALTPAQLEFLSEDEFVTIVPNFSQIPLQLISLSVRLDEFGRVLVDFGVQAPVAAFRPAVPVQVPLWLALHLRVQDKCRIRAPDWMQTDQLEDVLKKEKANSSAFETMPFHYVEIAEQLLSVAANDFVDAPKLRTLLKDIADQRGLKVHEGLRIMDAETTAVRLNHLSAMEANSVRDFLAAGLDLFAKLKDAEANSDATTQTPTQSSSAAAQSQALPPARNLRA